VLCSNYRQCIAVGATVSVFIYLLALAVSEAVCCKMGGCVMNGLERDVTRSSCGLVQGHGNIKAAVGRTNKYSQCASVRMVGVEIEI